MPLQPIVATWLAINAQNSASPSFFQNLRTGAPVFAGGLNPGDYFDLTNAEAAANSDTAIGTLYQGRFRWVLVDSGATAGNVKRGTIGLMPSLAAVVADGGSANTPPGNIVTSYDQSIGNGSSMRPVVFLNTVTPGNYAFVQELGTASVLGKSTFTGTPTQGGVVGSATGGVVDCPASSTAVTNTSLGLAIDLPVAGGIFKVMLQYVPVVQD